MTPLREQYPILHADYRQILNIIEPGSKVLDLGCGTGELLSLLIEKKQVIGRGVEIDEANVVECIKKGLSVFQGNIDEGLAEYQDGSHDYAVLNLTLQVSHNPTLVMQEMLRVAEKAIVSFPNFAYWRIRTQLFFTGLMPKSRTLPFEWYDTPNIRLVSIRDFRIYCKKLNIKILKEVPLLTDSREPGFFPQIPRQHPRRRRPVCFEQVNAIKFCSSRKSSRCSSFLSR